MRLPILLVGAVLLALAALPALAAAAPRSPIHVYCSVGDNQWVSDWPPVDRWGERTASGPIEFCYPEARAALIKEYMKGVMRGYDGISLYTYVENMALRYPDEFGFNGPIVQEFKRRFGVDIRTEPFDKEAWYRLRGEYLTQFLRELHMALAAAGKKLSITLRPNNPNIPQQWLCLAGEEGSGAGMIWMDWERWVQEGVVDEVFAWVGGDTKPLLNKAMPLAKGKPVEIVTYSSSPFGEHWNPYREQGVSICSVAAPGYGIDPWATAGTTAESRRDPDWRVRAQALVDGAAGKLTLTAEQIAALARDPHVLVRREAIRTLADPDVAVQMRAVQILEDIQGGLPQDVKDRAFALLRALFGEYGDGSQRSDRDWGWRAVGNALVAISPRGREVLEALRTRNGDRWLAWLAYEVLYVRQLPGAVLACTEERAVADHAAFAPPFPGRR